MSSISWAGKCLFVCVCVCVCVCVVVSVCCVCVCVCVCGEPFSMAPDLP